MFFATLRLSAIPLFIASGTVIDGTPTAASTSAPIAGSATTPAAPDREVTAIFAVQNAESAVHEGDNYYPPNINYVPKDKILMLHGALTLSGTPPERDDSKIRSELPNPYVIVHLKDPAENSKLTFAAYYKAYYRDLPYKVDWFEESSESNEELMKAAWPRDGLTTFTVLRWVQPEYLPFEWPGSWPRRWVSEGEALEKLKKVLEPHMKGITNEKVWALECSRMKGEAFPLYKLLNTLETGDVIVWIVESKEH